MVLKGNIEFGELHEIMKYYIRFHGFILDVSSIFEIRHEEEKVTIYLTNGEFRSVKFKNATEALDYFQKIPGKSAFSFGDINSEIPE